MVGFGFLVMILIMAIPVLLIVGGIILVVRLVQNNNRNNYNGNNTDRSNTGQKNSQALEIVNQRYARGEITEDEYRQMKKTLSE